jgi:cell division transport system permease protein
MAERHKDELGLRHALGERMLPALVAAMAFLAALALAGALAAAALSQRWQDNAAGTLTVQVPRPDGPLPRKQDGPEETRLDRVLARLRASDAVVSARALTADELTALLRPWLGAMADAGTVALPLPAVVEVHLVTDLPDLSIALAALSAALEDAAPGTATESHGIWLQRLSGLARSLQACAWLVLALVIAVACSVVTVATRAGLAARRESIEIVHGLGATDGRIAAAFGWRAMLLAGLGGLAGTLAALPVLIGLAMLVRPFAGELEGGLSDAVPGLIWWCLPSLPAGAAMLGWLTAQGTVRRWLRRLP